MSGIRRCSGRALAIGAVLVVTLGAPIAAISDTAYASGTRIAVAHDDTPPADPGTDPSSTDPATTDPATTDPATTDPATTDPTSSDPASASPADDSSSPSDTDAPTDTGTPTDSATALSSGPTLTSPGPPTNVTGSAGDGFVKVSWTPPRNDGGSPVTNYLVQSSPVSEGCSTPSTSCIVNGLTDGTPYTFTVISENDLGPSNQSDPSDPVTPLAPSPPPPTIVAPGAPGGVTASANPTVGLGKASISWSPVDAGGDSFVDYTVAGGGSGCSPTAATTCVVTGLNPGATYTFTVTASNSVGSTSGGTATVTLGSVPGAPTITKVVASISGTNGRIDVYWSAPSNTGGVSIDGYNVGSNPGGLGLQTNGSTFEYSKSGLPAGASYSFQVSARNAYNSPGTYGPGSPLSPVVTVPQPDAPPVVVTPTPTPTPTPTSTSTSSAPTGNGGASTGSLLLIRHTSLAFAKPSVTKGTTTVTAALTASGLVGGVARQQITVLVVDRLKHKSTHTIVTNNAGKASFAFKPQATTDVQLSYAGGPGYAAVTKTMTLVEAAPQNCHVTVKSGFGSASVKGTCSEAHLPKGTRLQLQYLSGKKWIAAASGKSTSTTLRFSLTLNRTGTYKVRVLLAANSVFGATTLTLPTLRVR